MNGTANRRDVELLDVYVEDAAHQRLRLMGWQRDKQFREDGGRIIYSVDTDILHLYLNPAEVSVSKPAEQRSSQRSRHGDLRPAQHKGPHPGYAEIFSDDPQELSTALGKAIADFIFFQLSKVSPILLFPPLEREVGKLFHTITLRADREHRTAQREVEGIRNDIVQVVERIQSLTSEDEKLRALLERMPSFYQLFFHSTSPSAQLVRFATLLERSRLMDLENFVREPYLFDKQFVDRTYRRLSTVRSWIQYSHLKGVWEDRLSRTKSPTAAKTMEADVHALARIEQLNSVLEKDGIRIIHITGDRAVTEAAGDFPDNEPASFGDLYIRDPRAFLAEPSVLFTDDEPERGTEKEVIPWLDVFLANFTDDERDLSRRLSRFLEQTPSERRRAVEGVLQRDSDAAKIFQMQWQRFCGPIALEHVQASVANDPDYFETYISILSSSLTKDERSTGGEFLDATQSLRVEVTRFGSILDELDNLLMDRVLRTWEECFAAATSTGFSLLGLADGTGRPSRCALPIMFSKFKKASDFFSAMLYQQDYSQYRNMISALREEDTTEYLFYLAFAGLFGARGKWRVAHILSSRALRIANGLESRTEISGREAYYLRGVARRMTARGLSDFDKSLIDLNEARRLLEESRAKVEDHPITQLRFDAEEVALELGRYLYTKYVKKDDGGGEKSFCGRLREVVKDMLPRVDLELQNQGACDRVRRALQVNYLSLLILEASSDVAMFMKGSVSDRDKEILGELRKGMEATSGKRILESFLHRAVFLVAGTIVEPAGTIRQNDERRSELEVLLSDESIAGNSVTPYDRARYEDLRDCGRIALGEGRRRREREGKR